MSWDETLSDNGIMMEEGEAAKALALGISEKTALSGSTTSVDISGMCNSLFEPISWGFCDAVDTVLSVLGPRFVDDNSTAYSSNIGTLIEAAGFTASVFGATNGEVRLRNGGTLFDSKWLEQRKGVLGLFVHAGVPVEGATFTEIPLDSGTWSYSYDLITGSTSGTASLPHSIDTIGSTATPTTYHRGTATYSDNVTLSSARRYYLCTGPIYQRADVVLSGHTVAGNPNMDASTTGHVFTVELPGLPVVIDLTAIPFTNGGNTLTLCVDNTNTYWHIPPGNPSLNCYNMLGGATLFEVGKLCFDPMAYGTRRCHLSASGTTITVKVKVKSNSNQTASDTTTVTAKAYYADGTTAEVTGSTTATIAPGESEAVTIDLAVPSASTNKWDLGNGKLYRVEVTLTSDNTDCDLIEDHVGFRSFSASKYNSGNDQYGFTLNGTGHSLYGVVYHHWDRMPTTAQLDADWDVITALKPQMVRFAYFPAMHYLLDKCDEAGIAAMVEIPWLRDFAHGEWDPSNQESYRNQWRKRYQDNITENALAMMKELHNHPSVLFYTLGTELGLSTGQGWYPAWYKDQAHAYIVDELLPAVEAEDTSRLFCIELVGSTPSSWTDVGDVMMGRMDSGWMSGSISGAANEANTMNANNATLPCAILNFSYGANPATHVAWSSASTKPSDIGSSNQSAYPEEYQAYCVEQYAGSVLTLKWPVFNLYGAVFDYAGYLNEGGKEGVYQTGLVTRDGSVTKDAYYYLKALWNSEPMVHITQKRYERASSPITLRLYTNCAKVQVYAGSTLLETVNVTAGSHVAETGSITLEDGNNTFTVLGFTNAADSQSSCSDTVVIAYEETSGTTRIVVYSDSAIVNTGLVNAAVLPSTEPQAVTWSSDTPSVATVNSGGTVTVVSDGTASIRATSTNDNTVTKAKSIPCFVRGATDSLVYQYTTRTNIHNSAGLRDVTVTDNEDGTVTLDGTLGRNWTDKDIPLFPAHSSFIDAAALMPTFGIPGNQLVTVEIVSGTVTGTYSGVPITVYPVNESFQPIGQIQLRPMSEVDGSGDVKATLVTGSTLGISGFKLNTTFNDGAVFDNLTLRLQSYKQADSYYNAGLFEGHLEPVNTIIPHSKNGSEVGTANMYSRNADGSHSEFTVGPNSGGSIPRFARVTDGFTCATNKNAILSGSTIAVPGDVLKFTVVMKNWPIGYSKKSDTSMWAFALWYADGSEAARLRWAYNDDDSGVDFTGATASTSFIATKVVDCAGWIFDPFSWGGPLDLTETVVWQMKLESVDPANIPPDSITVYGSTYIVNTGRLNAVGDPITANQSVTWSSSNTSVATIDSDGVVTVVADGSCTFTATSAVDGTKTGSVSVTCYKATTQNLLKNAMAAYLGSSTASNNGVAVSGSTDGTITFDGTSTAKSVGMRVFAWNASNNNDNIFLPYAGVDGDILVWMEVLGGTFSNPSEWSDHDYKLHFFDGSGTEITDFKLEYQEKPTHSGMTQAKLISGSTVSAQRVSVEMNRNTGTVYDDVQLVLGFRKLVTSGFIYGGGLLENYLPAVGSCTKLSGRNTPVFRYEDGSIIVYIMASKYWANGSKLTGSLTLTSGVAWVQNRASAGSNDTLATSGSTYKLRVQILHGISFTSPSNNTELTFVARGTDGTELAKLQYYKGSAYSSDFDSNGVGEKTFTPSANMDRLYIYYNDMTVGDFFRFAVKLEAVTT